MLTHDLLALIDEKHLLKHPFYQAWSKGTLSIEVIKKYAEQYYHLERNFPNFLSLMLMSCDDEGVRTKILENFNDETGGAANHRELWLRFGETIGLSRDEMKNSEMLPETAAAIAVFKELCSKSYLAGAAALAAYESQIPAIAAKKIEGLSQFYGIKPDHPGVEFFRVHGLLDVKHSEVWWDILEAANLTEEQRAEIKSATLESRDALWSFLTGVLKAYMPELLEMQC